jgi:hypothetical protein
MTTAQHTTTFGAAVCLAVAGLAFTAHAQTYLGALTWEADDGTGWTAGRLVTGADSVRVRLLAAWDPPNPAYAFAGCQFDAVVTTAHADIVSDAARPFFMSRGSTQTLAITRFGNDIKIDDRRDTMPPGLGTRGVFPGQLVEQFAGWPPPTHENPVSLFEFTLTFDGVAGSRFINSLYIAPSGGNTTDHVMRIYTTTAGAQMNPSTTTFPLEIVIVPAPGGIALALVAAAGLARRRRRA